MLWHIFNISFWKPFIKLQMVEGRRVALESCTLILVGISL